MDSSATLPGASTDSVDSNPPYDEELQMKEVKSGRTINFAEKLHLVLSNKECRDVISWLPSGQSFCITNKGKFVKAVLPKFFKSKANFNSFERRLKTWGFRKIDASRKVFVFSHDSFRRDVRAEEEQREEDVHAFNLRKQLRIVLSNADCRSFMWWLPSGESFCVASTSDSAHRILFRYFGETRFKSFLSTLKRDGFQRVKAHEFLGEAVYSHEFFRVGRPDLCRLMGRGGTVDLDGTEAATACTSGDGALAETTFLRPGDNNFSYPAAAAASLPTQGFLNPALNARRANMNMNFPIPVNVGFAATAFPGPQAMPTRVPPPRLTADPPFSNEVPQHSMNLFPFNGMRHPETLSHIQRLNAEPNFLFSSPVPRSLNPTQQFLLHQNRNVQIHTGTPSSMIPQTQIHGPSQRRQQVVLNMNPSFDESRTSLKGVVPMLSCHHSLLAANRKLQQHLMEHRKAETDSIMAVVLHRHDAAVPYQPKMSILEIEEELLKVKEMKLMMMKRKLEEQVELKETK